jgi:hypothetical protein
VKLTVTINCDNDSFDEPGDEVARLLRLIADVVKGHSKLALVQGFSSMILDRKLRHVGDVTFTETEGGAPSA